MLRSLVGSEMCIRDRSQIKSSAQRGIKSSLIDQYPMLEDIIDELLPKKELVQVKCQGHINLLTVGGEILFAQQRDGPHFPHLRLLHKYPEMLPHVRVDRGAIKHVLQGANIMCRGLTSAGADLPVDLPEDTVVAIMAEGKDHACAIGVTKMSTADIQEINADTGVTSIHYLNDGLWQITDVRP
eukprot:TRINITY_DN593_c0_g1_i1.p1 TRINITY_DN593_c0_g1~~TRINITY_DN593_c0_g1_i1.p1  ORF type:complete len:184 (-),score=48.16 TRINITY_DN593_c0_g1_i1:407-958(-)